MGPGLRRDEEGEPSDPISERTARRFGYDVDLGGEAEDNPWIRQVLLRRTQRR